MQREEIVTRLAQIADSPSETIYSITIESILEQLAQRLGDEALTLSPEDIQLACDEVRTAIDHNLDERDYIDMGLDAWEIVRNL
jgi:hypothetical protein